MVGIDSTKTYNLKVEKKVLYLRNYWELVAWETLSQMTLRNCSKGVLEETGYTGVFLKTKQENKMHGQTSKYHLSSQKKQALKLMIVVLLHIWEDARLWAHWNYSFDMHVSYLFSISILFSILNSPKGITLRMTAKAGGRKHSLFIGRAGSIYFFVH